MKNVFRDRPSIPHLQQGKQFPADLFHQRKLFILPQKNKAVYCAICRYPGLGAYAQSFSSDGACECCKTSSETISNKPPKFRSFNDSIGIMLRTYARAIQKQEKIEGSLF